MQGQLKSKGIESDKLDTKIVFRICDVRFAI
jgi:hypothetical protein